MNQYFTVVKLLFKNMFKSSGKNKKSTRAMIAAMVLMFLLIAALVVFFIVTMVPMFKELNLINELITLVLIIASVVVLFFGIASTISFLYFSKDSEFFLSLPIKAQTVFAAKFTVVYLLELALTAAILLPAFIAIGAVAALPIGFYFIMLLGILLAPTIPLVLATIIAIPLMYLVSFFRNRSVFSTIALIIVFGAVFTAYILVVNSITVNAESTDYEAVIESLRTMLVTLSNIFYPFYALAKAATLTIVFSLGTAGSVVVNLLIFILAVTALLAVALFISSMVYKRSIAAQLESKQRKSSAKVEFKQSGVLKALLKKEFKEIVRTPAIAFQCLTGIIICPLMVVLMTVLSSSSLTGMNDIFGKDMVWYVVIGIMLMMAIGINVSAPSAISREGKNFYFVKMIPVSYQIQLKAKFLLSMIISSIAVLLSLIVLCFTAFNALNFVLALLFIFIYSYGANALGIFIDLSRPKLDWNNPQEVVKNSLNITVTTFANMGMGAVVIVIGIVVSMFLPGIIGAIIIWAVYFSIAIAIALVGHISLFKNGAKMVQRIEV